MLAHPEYIDQMTDRTVVARSKNEFPFEMQRGITLEGVVSFLRPTCPRPASR